MYDKIYNFCKIRNNGPCFKNGATPPPRVEFLMDLCDQEGLKYELDVWEEEQEGFKEYSILDFPYLQKKLSEEQIKKGSEIFQEFNQKLEELDLDPDIDLDFMDADDLDLLGPDFEDLFFEYTRKLNSAIGKIERPKNNFYNIVLMGNSDKWVVAHHDIVNPQSDNANDNSCSVINALAIKKARPNINVVLLDGEEPGGIGSQRLSDNIKTKGLKCKWILNLELTGRGGKNFFVGAMGTQLTDWILGKFDCPQVRVPFNDSVIFKKNGINSTVINPLPITEEKTSIVTSNGEFLDEKLLFLCHRMEDSVDKISPADMKEFVEEICLKIIDEA